MSLAVSKHGKGRKIPIRIDSKTYQVTEESLTGIEIRQVPEPPIGPDRDLYLDVDGPVDDLVEDSEPIELYPQIEFFSVVRKINPGRDDTLAAAVRDDMKRDGGAWETTPQGAGVIVVRKDLALPPGLTPTTVDLLLELPGGFPTIRPDMFWLSQAVTINGLGAPPGCGATRTFDGRAWQRWSRHIGAAWRPGLDGLATYLAYVRRCLSIEAAKARKAA